MHVSDVVVENSTEGTDLVLASVTYTLPENVENLTLTGSSAINGTGNTLDNVITGNTGSNIIDGGAGNDTIIYTSGFDTLDGGAGTDTADLSGFGAAVYVYLPPQAGADVYTKDSATLSQGTWRGIAHLDNIENVIGTPFADLIYGDSADNVITPGAGNDTVYAGGGNDVISGGAGNDTLIGGAGSDRFVFNSISEGTDTITDFTRGAGGDALDIRNVLVGYSPSTSVLADFVQLSVSGSNTTILVDANGTAGGANFAPLVTLQGVTGLLLGDLVHDRNILFV